MEKKKKKHLILKILLVPVLAVLLLFVTYMVWSLAHTSRAAHSLAEYQAEYPDVTITQDDDGAVSLLPDDEDGDDDKGIVFYSGMSVEPLAYVPLLAELAENDYHIYAPAFPCGMALLDTDAATEVIKQHPEIETWYIAGHSLGGRCATIYAASGSSGLNGVIAISSRADEELADEDIPLLMMYGDRDGIYKGVSDDDDLPEDTTVFCIPGANHAQFGDYGKQLIDNDASISAEEQRKEGTDEMLKWLGGEQPG